MNLGVAHGFICTANKDGSIPLNSRAVAKVESGAEEFCEDVRDRFNAYPKLMAALEKCRNELLGADNEVSSESWKEGIRDAIKQAEEALGVK